MSDAAVIEPTLSLLRAIWTANPDLTLGRIIHDATPERCRNDPALADDEELFRALRRMVGWYPSRTLSHGA